MVDTEHSAEVEMWTNVVHTNKETDHCKKSRSGALTQVLEKLLGKLEGMRRSFPGKISNLNTEV